MTDLVFKIYDLKIWNTLIIDSKKFVFRREVILIEKKNFCFSSMTDLVFKIYDLKI